MSKTALGLIETYGYTASVEAADVCLKAANVSLSAWTKVRGGLVTIEIIGDVGAVKAAIDAAEAAVPRVGKLISTHVIPRPAAGLDSILGDSSSNSKESNKDKNQKRTVEKNENQVKKEKTTKKQPTKKELKDHKVVELRSLARELKNIKLTNKEIKYARKKELIEAILKAKRKGSDI